MTAQIASILKNRLSTIYNGENKPTGLLFIDKLAGLVQTGEKAQPINIEGAFAVSKFPMSVDSDYQECLNTGCYKDLVPNSKLKGILYFESLGTSPIGLQHGNFKYRTRLRLVCWINNKLIQGNNCISISQILITQIRNSLEKNIINVEPFVKISVTATNIIDNDIKLFSNYTYPSESVKFLMYPYEAFGIDYNIEYTISNNCIQDLEINPELC